MSYYYYFIIITFMERQAITFMSHIWVTHAIIVHMIITPMTSVEHSI